jgi:hypothetical protein
MGSGSGGGGGGGSGGATAGGGQGYGGYRIKGARLLVHNVDATAKAEAVRSVLKKLRPEYLHEQFVDSSAREVYRELSRMNVDLSINRSWEGISRRLGVDGGPGCLLKLVAALMRRLEVEDGNRKSHSFVRMALENFLLRMLGDDPQLLVSASAEQVIEYVDRGVFERQSGLFLGDLLYEVVRAEERALPQEVKSGLRGVVQATADGIVSDFEARFRGKPLGEIRQVSYRDLFDVIRREEDWFLSQLRR